MIRFQTDRGGICWEFWPGFFGVLALWWELSGAGETAALAMLAAVLLHESGHLFFFRQTGIPVDKVLFDFRGVTIRPAEGIYPHRKLLLTSAGGCIFSIIGVIAGWLLSVSCGVSDIWWQASAAAAIYSLLPLPGTDGAECFRCLFAKVIPRL